MDNRYAINSKINNLQKYNVSYARSSENIIKYFNSNYNDISSDLMNVKLSSKKKDIEAKNGVQDLEHVKGTMNEKGATSIHSQIKALQEVKFKLENILNAAGYENININFKYGCTKPAINFNAYESNKNKYEGKIKERLDNL